MQTSFIVVVKPWILFVICSFSSTDLSRVRSQSLDTGRGSHRKVVRELNQRQRTSSLSFGANLDRISGRGSVKKPPLCADGREKCTYKILIVDRYDPSIGKGNTDENMRMQIRYRCPEMGCSRNFNTSGHARRHSRIHYNTDRFICPHDACSATFSRRDNCTQHQRSKHHIVLVQGSP